MAFFSRLRSSYKLNKFIQTSFIPSNHTPPQSRTLLQSINTKQSWSWRSFLLPIVLAVSGGSFALQSQKNPSLCDAPSPSHQQRIGGKDSTKYVVKGTYKPVPPDLITELKAICQDNMTLDYDERYFHGKPQYSFHKAVNIPDVVVFPR